MKLSLIIIILIILYYCNYKKAVTLIKQNIIHPTINQDKLKVITYNIQRLPYLIRPSFDILHLLDKYDIICLQEDFYPSKKLTDINYNLCHIGTNSIFKLVDSGISIYSRIPLEFIEFISFQNLKSVDKLSDKGFLVMKHKDIYFFNIHLQSSYFDSDNNGLSTVVQLNQITDYITKNKIDKFIIIGDFNMELDILHTQYNKIVPDRPTHYQKPNSLFNSSAFHKKNYIAHKFDGAIYNNLNITNIETSVWDDYADHMCVSFDLNL